MDEDPADPVATLVMSIGGTTFYPEPADGPSAEAFFSMLEKGPMRMVLKGDGDCMVSDSACPLPYAGAMQKVQEGDLLLCADGRIAVSRSAGFQEAALLASTRYRREFLSEALSGDAAEAQIWLEWSERGS